MIDISEGCRLWDVLNIDDVLYTINDILHHLVKIFFNMFVQDVRIKI